MGCTTELVPGCAGPAQLNLARGLPAPQAMLNVRKRLSLCTGSSHPELGSHSDAWPFSAGPDVPTPSSSEVARPLCRCSLHVQLTCMITEWAELVGAAPNTAVPCSGSFGSSDAAFRCQPQSAFTSQCLKSAGAQCHCFATVELCFVWVAKRSHQAQAQYSCGPCFTLASHLIVHSRTCVKQVGMIFVC